MTSKILLEVIKTYPLLTPEQELELGRRVKNGDMKARETLILSNVRLVLHVAKKYRNQVRDTEDLVSVGFEGLTNAVDRYDPEKGGFARFAVYSIRGEMTKMLMCDTSVQIGPHAVRKLWKARKYGGQDSSSSRVAEALKVTHLEAKISNDDEGSNTVADMIPDDAPTPSESVVESDMSNFVRNFYKLLPSERHRKAISIRFCLGDNDQPATLKDVGDALGVTKERARQILNDAMAEMESIERSLQKRNMRISKRELVAVENKLKTKVCVDKKPCDMLNLFKENIQ